MNMTEDKRLSDQRLREHLIRLGIITPAKDWRAELEEYEADRNTHARTRPGRAHLRLVYSGAERGR